MEATNVTTEFTAEGLSGEQITDIVFRLLIFVGGILGNSLVIFVILFLNEFQKISHWYVLQLALADFLFLMTLPFKVSEMIHKEWIYPVGLCQARQTILFFNYYASIMFLMIMAIDRYLAVCHALSIRVQRMRSQLYSYVITAITWAVTLVLCIPVMMYTDVIGIQPNCICALDFPKDKMHWCVKNMPSNITECYATNYDELHGKVCSSFSTIDYYGESSGFYGDPSDYDNDGLGDADYSDYSGYFPSGSGENNSGTEHVMLQNGCFYNMERPGWHVFIYFNFIVMFVLPFLIISICYTLIVVRLMGTNVADRRGSKTEPSYSNKGSKRKLWRSARRRSSSASTGNAFREKVKVTVMCAALVLLFIICWLPFHSVHLAKISGIPGSTEFCARLGTATSILAYLNSALNPYLYNFLGTFQKRMKQVRKHKRMQSFLSATGLTRIGGRSNSMQSSESSRDRKRSSVPNESRSGSIPNEKIALHTMEDPTTTT